MKLNEPQQMWVVVDANNEIVKGTLREISTRSQRRAEGNTLYTWRELEQKGYRCIPVTVTITETE